jgi:hypothetical protein
MLRLFTGRAFHGGDSDTGEMDAGAGAMLTLMAMPGLLVSLLAFEKYGSLMMWLRGGRALDPFKAALPDEYLFIVLSLVTSAGAALWRWDSIFPDRRDYTNLVPLPVKLGQIFAANLCAILVVCIVFTGVANAASALFFPIAVVGSQSSALLFLRFAGGHILSVATASVFGCLAVFALTGVLMAVLPAAAFRRISHLVRFILATGLLALLASSFAVPELLGQMSVPAAHRLALLPPFSFLGIAQTIWGKGGESFVEEMLRSALLAIGLAFGVALIGYTASFRRSFLRIPETPDAGPLPQSRLNLTPFAWMAEIGLRGKQQRASYQFVARTMLRSERHLQILLGFLALGLVLSASALSSADLHRLVTEQLPPLEVLSIPFILSFCVAAGVRFAFEVPAELRANWVFRFWLDRDRHNARAIARLVLLVFTLPWLLPICFGFTVLYWGWVTAALHTAVVGLSTAVLAELSLLRFRKLPFTCSYPQFKSHSGLVITGYLFAYLFYTGYLVQVERWSLYDPWRAVAVVPLAALVLAGVRYYREQMLEMDKQLLFEEAPASAFW